MQNTVHFILQGKGGIGKSFVSTLIAQYFNRKGAHTVCFDTDQENTTFKHYKALNVQHVQVMNEARVIDQKGFDKLIESILEQEGTFVIDTGANTFSNLLAYMVENSVIEILNSNDRKVFIHTIIGGGDTLLDTANGFNSVAQAVEQVGGTSLVLWLNEHFGSMQHNGNPFQESKVFKAHEDKLVGVVVLHDRNKQTFGDDIKRMNTARLTVDEVLQSPNFGIMEKSRIRTVATDVFNQLDKVVW